MAKAEDLDSPEEEYNDNEDVYKEKERDDLVEDDEISPEEDGFMDGAQADGERAKCANCGRMLISAKIVEKEFEGELKWFCSDHCAGKFEEKRKEEEED